MKKLIGTVAVAALLAGAAFADGISFGSWGRGMWVIGNGAVADKSEVVTDIHQSWGGNAPRTALGVQGSSENVGFVMDIHGNGTGLGIGDNALIWVKPVDVVKFWIGANVDQNVLRSDAAFGLWNWDRIGIVGSDGEEGFIFDDNEKTVSAVITPIEGLTILAGVNPQVNNPGKFGDVLKNTFAVAFGYTIADVGTIKASLAGLGSADPDKTRLRIEAAFELTALENIYIALGAKIPVGGDSDLDTNVINVNAYARLGMIENLAIHLLVGTKLNSPDLKEGKKDGAFGFRFEAGVDYSMDNGIGIFADAGYANGIYMAGTSADKNDCVTFGLGVTKGFSNGVMGVAFEGATNGKGRFGNKEADEFKWEVPVKVEYWF